MRVKAVSLLGSLLTIWWQQRWFMETEDPYEISERKRLQLNFDAVLDKPLIEIVAILVASLLSIVHDEDDF